MTNEELNRLAATKIMGWELRGLPVNDVYCDPDGREGIEFYWWNPCKNIEHAMMLWEKVKQYYWIEMMWHEEQWNVTIIRIGSMDRAFIQDISLPTAITRAILKAEGVL